ncbi:sensor domain-containing diguanylate cyclase [Prosthecomicrobium sp. N25]|uniref:sensor domain-containing diguanylate cyclase n=1 Tax=Prosthecomicrobium sp. N25 TaxID=3129254 RepID=UPI003076A3EC
MTLAREFAVTSTPADSGKTSALEILTSVGEVVYDWTLRTDRLVWGANALEVIGVPGFDAIATGKAWRALIDPESGDSREDAIASAPNTDDGRGVPYASAYRLRPQGPSGPSVPVEDVGRWYADSRGRPERAQGVIRLAGARRAAEGVSRFDPLTGQLDRTHLLAALGEALPAIVAARKPAAFLLVSVDGLAEVNESLGIAAGDQVIAEAARRIRAQLRAGDIVGRYSGSLLGILVMNCSERAMARAAERFATAARKGILEIGAAPIGIAVTIGGVSLPRQARTTEEAMLGAERALRQARRVSPGGFAVLAPDGPRPMSPLRYQKLCQEIVAGLNDRRLALAFEVVVDPTGAAVGRKASPVVVTDRGDRILAEDLGAVAARAGLSEMIDQRALELALAELGAAAAADLSLPVSAESLSAGRLVAQWKSATLRHPEIAGRLTIEVAVPLLAARPDACRHFAAEARAVGLGVAVTGFGVGPVALEDLRLIAPRRVELAPGLTERALAGPEEAAYVAALAGLVRAIGAEPCCTGVAAPRAARALAAQGLARFSGPFTADGPAGAGAAPATALA